MKGIEHPRQTTNLKQIFERLINRKNPQRAPDLTLQKKLTVSVISSGQLVFSPFFSVFFDFFSTSDVATELKVKSKARKHSDVLETFEQKFAKN